MRLKDLKIPKSWEEVSYNRYQQIQDAKFVFTDLDKAIVIVSALTDLNKEQVKQFNLTELTAIITSCPWLSEDPNSDKHFFDDVVINGYSIPQNLSLISIGAWADITALLAEDPNENLCRIIACMMTKKDTDYSFGYAVSDLEPALRDDIPVTKLFSILVFFCEIAKQLSNNTPQYL